MGDFKNGKSKAWFAFWKRKRIWQSTADIKLKIKFFKAPVFLVLSDESYVIGLTLK